METADLLEAFFTAQREEGRYFDTASFSIDSVKAMEKLTAFQLAESGMWLVKLVQAAVAAGAGAIDITFERRKVKVAFTPTELWQADKVLETVLSGVLPQNRGLLHLVTAIRGSSAGVTETVGWSCGEATVSLSHEACQIRSQLDSPVFTLEATRPARSRSLSHTLASSVFQLAKQTVEEHDAVRARCWVCPVPIRVDGQALESGYDLVEGGHLKRGPMEVLRNYQGNQQMVNACLGLRPLSTAGDRPEIPYLHSHLTTQASPEENQVEVVQPVYSGQTFLHMKAHGPTCPGAVAIFSGIYAADSRVDFVLDGAVVACHRLPDWKIAAKAFFGMTVPAPPIGARAVVGVEAGELDLSGFAIRPPDLEGLMSWIGPDLTELGHKIAESMESFYYVPFARKFAPLVGLGVGWEVLAVVSFGQGLLLFPLAGVAAAIVAINTMAGRKRMKKAIGELTSLIVKDGVDTPPGVV